jgi:hypothetical protein
MIDQYLKPNVKRGAILSAIIGTLIGILSAIPLLGCLLLPVTCIIALLLPFVTGWLVAQWGRTLPMGTMTTPFSIKSDSPYATPALDGAVAAGIGALISGLIVWVCGLLFAGLFATTGIAGDPGSAGSSASGLVIGAVGGVVSVIVTTIVAAIAGAIGGIIYIVFSSSRTRTA